MATTLRVVVTAIMVIAFALTQTQVSVQAHNVHTPVGKNNISCMLVFGDSSVDPGNNNHLKTDFKANFLPYGKNLLNGEQQDSGRFTNGMLPTDMTAEALGIKEIIPPFLDPNLKKGDLVTGVSFASSASGYDDLTANLTNVLPVFKQLEYFRHYKIHLRNLVGAKKAEEIVENALFVLSMGTNDFIQNYYVEPTRSKQFTLEQYTDYLTTSMAQDIKEMHRHGAKKLVVVGLPPLGCMPLIRTLMGGSSACFDTYNKAAFLMNSKIKYKLGRLRRSLGMKIVYEDIYVIFQTAMKFPHKYGLTETSKGCVGSGTMELGTTCRGQSTCKDPSKYMFWDSVHPTEKMYKIVADDVLRLISRTF